MCEKHLAQQKGRQQRQGGSTSEEHKYTKLTSTHSKGFVKQWETSFFTYTWSEKHMKSGLGQANIQLQKKQKLE